MDFGVPYVQAKWIFLWFVSVSYVPLHPSYKGIELHRTHRQTTWLFLETFSRRNVAIKHIDRCCQIDYGKAFLNISERGWEAHPTVDFRYPLVNVNITMENYNF